MEPSFVTPPVPARPRSFGALLGDALRRPGGRRGISVLSLVLFLAGVAMFAYPVGTDFYSRYQQDRLQGTFSDPGLQQAYLERKIGVGDGLTLLRIPKLDVKVLVVEGTTPSALRAGAGHYVGTPLPGEVGNVGIAGHRTTFGRPFNRLDELGPGDVVTLETPFATYTYKGVPAFLGHDNPWVVKPSDFSVVSQGTGHLLTLTTCHPKGSARQRLVMRFSLVKTELKPDLTQGDGK
jgi:sortase A